MDTIAPAADAQSSQPTPSSAPAWKANLAKAQAAGREFWKKLTPEQRAAQIEKMQAGRRSRLHRQKKPTKPTPISTQIAKQKARNTAKEMAAFIDTESQGHQLDAIAAHLSVLADFAKQIATISRVIAAYDYADAVGASFDSVQTTISTREKSH